jgi:hypothetical protein
MRPLAVAAVLSALACAAPQTADGKREDFYALEGEVREAGTNRLLPGARVEIVGATRVDGRTMTDVRGRFSVVVFVSTPPVAPEVARDRPDAGAPAVVMRVDAGTLCSDPKRITLTQGMDPLTIFVRSCN